MSQAITDGKLETSNFGTNGSQTLELNGEETKWVVFGYEDKDKDGLNEVLLLTTEYPTNGSISFYGSTAYNNAVDEINRMCEELYGTSARGMTIEDVNRVLGYEPAGGMYYLYGTYNTTGSLTIKIKDWEDVWTSIRNNNNTYFYGNFYDPSHPEGVKDSGAALGEYELNGYFYVADQSMNVPTGVASVASKISSVAKAMVFGSNCNYYYWLASSGVHASSNYAVFFRPWLRVQWKCFII